MTSVQNMEQKMIASMQKRTGRTLEEWMEKARRDGIPDGKGRLKWLKEMYGLGQSTAYVILNHLDGTSLSSIYSDGDKLVADQFQGENAELRALYDFVKAEIEELGDGVSARPCKTYVPFYKKRQFAIVKPYRGKLHVGLALPDAVSSERLESAKGLGFTDRVKLKFSLEKPEELDAELRALLQLAYESN
ncbi:hypothetical protein CIG75_02285 [Tumebacillus algifaecis]|uniref:DUF5655 domain-containing protein n=1 Tax=Tumebacillus algifaecis TaxID=1214604 RepID=A0A223CX20_9BACL|nr:DUF5655 domain-containing protein [Tumebacillus algifaecis]ASS73919.1 hypothetical protein CIG75_02285 [Tumebacillus algifaecis]